MAEHLESLAWLVTAGVTQGTPKKTRRLASAPSVGANLQCAEDEPLGAERLSLNDYPALSDVMTGRCA